MHSVVEIACELEELSVIPSRNSWHQPLPQPGWPHWLGVYSASTIPVLWIYTDGKTTAPTKPRTRNAVASPAWRRKIIRSRGYKHERPLQASYIPPNVNKMLSILTKHSFHAALNIHRYRLGDVVTVKYHLKELPAVTFSHRIGQVLDVRGEKVRPHCTVRTLPKKNM